ncbi:MAG: hypothetical protein HQL54_03355 [Magnetococcales bacterium]|nr:hypothetical protein [Magnetococcales bacterium]
MNKSKRLLTMSGGPVDEAVKKSHYVQTDKKGWVMTLVVPANAKVPTGFLKTLVNVLKQIPGLTSVQLVNTSK